MTPLSHVMSISSGSIFTWIHTKVTRPMRSCLKCDQPNYSSVSSLSLHYFHSENNFSVLSPDRENTPCTNNPLPSRTQQSRSTKMQDLTILNINFQSVKNKTSKLCILLETEKPEIVVGT